MSLDDVRALLVSEARKLEAKPWRSTGIGLWCREHGVRRGHVSEFLNGKRLPPSDILAALGLEWRIVPKDSPGWTERGEQWLADGAPACLCSAASGTRHAPYCLAQD